MIDGKQSLIELETLSKKVAAAISELDSVRLISHNDADGISAAGIMCNALHRSGIQFHATIVSHFDQSTIELIEKTSSGTVILCDMGSGQTELSSKIKEAIIIDHHKPTGELEHLQLNPHLVGIDGSSELCASCGAYMVAREMGENTDLAGLAIAGATGDKQPMKGANKFILDEAVEKKIVSVRKGLRMGDDPVGEFFESSIDPFLDITGDKDKIRGFLEEAGVGGRIKDLTNEQMTKFASLIALKLARQGSLPAIESLIGEIFILNNEVISNMYDLVNVLNACGNAERAGLGLAVCMRDTSAASEALETMRENQRVLISTIRKAQTHVRSGQNLRYVMLEDSSGTGAIAGTMTRYLFPDKPFVTLNEVENMIKISARGTRKLVAAGLDLAAGMREAASSVGGMGGGHDVASGATIPKGTAMKFIDILDSIIGKQLKGKA
ncbi:MAG: DHH family phosphoesterase [Candidatus Methanoperedens sp.]|nr:DHH family phosphoesterase [Candidatus Methanoperedens sp.]MCZ7371690.1 DHH family phosphoesterase [Candidatus Methanoperedens sp.]